MSLSTLPLATACKPVMGGRGIMTKRGVYLKVSLSTLPLATACKPLMGGRGIMTKRGVLEGVFIRTSLACR